MCHCSTDDISGCCRVQSRENPTQSFSKTRFPFLIFIQYLFYSFYYSTPNSNLFFCYLHLVLIYLFTKCYKNLGCISDLNVCVKIENLRDWFIVGIDELTTHGSFWKDHKWIHIVDWSVQKIPQRFILILVSLILVNACKVSRHEWKEKPAFTVFLETRCTMTEWMIFKSVPEQCCLNIDIPPKWISF